MKSNEFSQAGLVLWKSHWSISLVSWFLMTSLLISVPCIWGLLGRCCLNRSISIPWRTPWHIPLYCLLVGGGERVSVVGGVSVVEDRLCF